MLVCRYRFGVVSGPQSKVKVLATVPRQIADRTNMLIDQDYPNVLPLGRESLKRGLDSCSVRLRVDN